jgi:transcriptional regulator with XRE-family HTH domain
MALTALLGTRLRERRLALGMRQAEVAASVGVSASYLNLIEHNRRRVSGTVLEGLAGVLGLDPAALEEGAGGGIVEELRAAAAVAGPGVGAEVERVEEFAGRFPGWAAAVVALERQRAGLVRAVEALNDRMTHDPHLSDSLHEVLSAVASVRSTAAILAETEEIDPVWRARFLRNLHVDSERLAVGAEALVGYLDGSDLTDVQGIAAPQEEMEGWLAARGWALPELEPGGGGLAALEAEVAGLASGAARGLARGFLGRFAAEVAVLPLGAFDAVRAECGGDVLRVAARFGVPVVAVMRRIALRAGAAEGLVVCDGSGTLVFRKAAEGFALPRFGAACPLWPLYAALGRPGSPVVAEVETAGQGRRRFRAVAVCGLRHPEGLGGVELREAAMLMEPAGRRGPEGVVLPVGTSCRICPRESCAARREPSILGVDGEAMRMPF